MNRNKTEKEPHKLKHDGAYLIPPIKFDPSNQIWDQFLMDQGI